LEREWRRCNRNGTKIPKTNRTRLVRRAEVAHQPESKVVDTVA